jgi:membrane-associated PAP2 superfamily phosphatase
LRRPLAQLGALAAAAVLIWVVFHAWGVDRWISSIAYDAGQRRFPLKDAWVLAVPGHTGLKWLMLGFWVFCLAWGGSLRRGALYMALIAAAVSLMKYYSPVSCPWDLVEYGGRNPATGRCLPAAHPLTGFALFGLYLALRDGNPRAARYALAAGWIIGLAAGAIQIARGAHFLSHVLWTAWVAWGVTLALAALERRRAAARPAHSR